MANRDDFNRNAEDPREVARIYGDDKEPRYSDEEINDMAQHHEAGRAKTQSQTPTDMKNRYSPYDGQTDTAKEFNKAHDNVDKSPETIETNFNTRATTDEQKAKVTRESLQSELDKLKAEQNNQFPNLDYTPTGEKNPPEDPNVTNKREKDIRNLETLLSFANSFNRDSRRTYERDAKTGISREFERVR